MPDSYERVTRNEDALAAAEANTEARMKPVNEIVALFLSKRNEMARLSLENSAPVVDVAAVIESVTEWAGGIRAEIRKEEFQGEIEWHR